jgi:hypothetical protein
LKKCDQKVRKQAFTPLASDQNSMENNPKNVIFRLKSTYEEISLRNILAGNIIKIGYNHLVRSF